MLFFFCSYLSLLHCARHAVVAFVPALNTYFMNLACVSIVHTKPALVVDGPASQGALLYCGTFILAPCHLALLYKVPFSLWLASIKTSI